MTPRAPARSLAVLSLALCLGCDADLGMRAAQSGGSFGSIVFREVCQRVAYSTEAAARAAGAPGARKLDVSGVQDRALCAGSLAPPADADPALVQLVARRAQLVDAIDAALPDTDAEHLPAALDAYLRQLTPLEDDGTVTKLLKRSGDLLDGMARDADLTAGLAHLGRYAGITPPETAGAVLKSAVSAPGVDDVVQSTLPLFAAGGAARAEFLALLAAGAFELRHLAVDADPRAPDRTPRLLRDLLVSRSMELIDVRARPLYVALRDEKGRPVPAMGQGQPVSYVPPLPEPGEAKGKYLRDASGRALAKDGGLLYSYADLNGSFGLALLEDAHRLFDPQKHIPFGLLRGAARLAGSRVMLAKQRDGESLAYQGFGADDAVILDLAHAAAQALRFQSASMKPGDEIVGLLKSVQALMADPSNEGPLSRALKGLLDAADEAKKHDYDAVKLPADSTLYDDLAPVLARIFAVPGLVEDIVAALDPARHPEGKALGPITAQLMTDRGYFFMRQPTDADVGKGPLDPADNGVVGSFGHPVDRSQPDSDATLDWKGQKTADPRNNRSVFQRLLQVLSDSNGQKLCNGTYADGGRVFLDNCDMFQIDNLAQFFLLAVASPALRSDPATFARQAASFVEAIKNGRDCRGTAKDPDAANKCVFLKKLVRDDARGDEVLAGLMGIVGFGRYPEPAAAGRALFVDLQSITQPYSPKDLLLNHVNMIGMDGSYVVDAADPDPRKIGDPADRNNKHLFIDERNGVLFALEKVSAPVKMLDGSTQNVNFYQAMRPLVDAFAKHAECFPASDPMCAKGQNATQILADAMTVLHRHWPTARSQLFGRSFADSYGPLVRPDGARSYEPLAAKIMAGDLLPATADLSPILLSLSTDTGQKSLPIIARLLRFLFDPSQTPDLKDRKGNPARSVRNDRRDAYDDPTLTQVLGRSGKGGPTIYYLFADALSAKRAVLDRPENQADKDQWNQAVSDLIDAFLKVDVGDKMGQPQYRFDNPRIRPVTVLLLDFLLGRVTAHRSDLSGWTNKLIADLAGVDKKEGLSGPLFAALVDLSVKLDAQDDARRKTAVLLQQLLDENNQAGLRGMAVATVDATQLLLDDMDLVPVGRGLAAALDVDKGPVDPGLTLLRRSRELASDKTLLLHVLANLYTQHDVAGAYPVYPMFRIADAIAEVDRATPGQPGPYTPDDYRALLGETAHFLKDQDRGLTRFIDIVQHRCVSGSPDPSCPK